MKTFRSRLQMRASRARDKRDAAFAELDSFVGDPLTDETAAARWRHLVRMAALAKDTARLATAKADADALPAAKRTRTVRRQATSGTVVVPDGAPEVAAVLVRVVPCSVCQRHVQLDALTDAKALWAQGWWSRRNTDLPDWPRIWTCPDCVVERLVGVPDGSSPVGRGGLVFSAETRRRILSVAHRRATSHERRRLEADLSRLSEVDPGGAATLLREVIYAAPSKHTARQWRAVWARLFPQPKEEYLA